MMNKDEIPTPRTDAIFDHPRGDRTWIDVVKTHREHAIQLERELFHTLGLLLKRNEELATARIQFENELQDARRVEE